METVGLALRANLLAPVAHDYELKPNRGDCQERGSARDLWSCRPCSLPRKLRGRSRRPPTTLDGRRRYALGFPQIPGCRPLWGWRPCSTLRRYRGSIGAGHFSLSGITQPVHTADALLINRPNAGWRCNQRAAGHSWRSARIGSTLVARSAGIRLASTATTIRNSAAPAMLTGSAGLTW